MGEKHKEIYFFLEISEETDSNVYENRLILKHILNYMNKFAITEDDGFEIGGIFSLYKLPAKILPAKIIPLKTSCNIEDLVVEKDLNFSQEICLHFKHTQRRKVFKNLAAASVNVNVFIAGRDLWKDDGEAGYGLTQYVDLKIIIDEILSSIVKNKIEYLQVSVMELSLREMRYLGS